MRGASKPSVTSLFLGIYLPVASITLVRDDEKRAKMKDLPKAVLSTVLEQSNRAALRGLTKEVEKGSTYYEPELRFLRSSQGPAS